MSFEVTTRTLGEGAFLSRRQVSTDTKTIDTPAKAVPVARARASESFADGSRRTVELYAEVNTRKLEQARRGDGTSILTRLNADAPRDEEMVFAFVSYEEGHVMSPKEARQIAEAVAETGDIVTVPLQPELKRAIESENGLGDPAFQSYRDGVETYLQTVEEQLGDILMMGTVPMLDHVYVEDLLELYLGYDIEHFGINFDRHRATANRQVSELVPIARYFGRRGLEEETLLYGINLTPQEREIEDGISPAANFAAVGLGFDVIGESHVSPPGDPSKWESPPDEVKIEEAEDPEIEFELFVRDELTFREFPLSELLDHWPEDSGIEIDRAIERARASDQARRRVERLVNAEQMALAMGDLREALDGGDVIEYLAEKEGVTPEVLNAFQTVRDALDAGREQTDLADF
jgi:hypothetical protein